MHGHTEAGATYRFNEPPYTLLGPMSHNDHHYTNTSYRCHDFAASSPAATLQAGGHLDVEWTLEARHPGDCSFYISFDSDVTIPSTWLKLADIAGCGASDGLVPPASNQYRLSLPEWLPPSGHAVLRWEWLSTQQTTNVEFYVTCADVSVNSTGASGSVHEILAVVEPLVTISGVEHLPQDASAYRDVS